MKTASLFLVFGLIWLAGYNRLLVPFTQLFPGLSPGLLPYLINAFFIVVSTVLIYFIIRHDFLRNNTYSTQYRQLFYEHPVPMWIYQWGTLKFLAVNNAAVSKYGFSRKEFEAMDILSIREPSSIPAVLDDVKRTDKNLDYRGIWQHRKKNGELFYVELYSHTTRYNGKEARIVMAIDIDSEVRNTIKAKDIGTRYELLAQVTQDCIYYWDLPSGRVTRNHGPATMFGYKEEEVLEHMDWWKENVHPEDIQQVMDSFRECVQSKSMHWNTAYRFRCADGNYKYVLDRAHVLYNDHGHAMRVIGAIQDVDESMRHEEERRQFIRLLQEQNEKLQEIARINSHEIRRPVSNIMGILAMLDLEKNEPALNGRLFGLLQQSTAELDATLFRIRDKLQQMRE